MPWCPNCRFEYVDGVQTCTDCGAALVDEEPTGKRPRKKREEQALYAPSFRPMPVADGVVTELLMAVSTRAEADEIEAALVAGGVPVNREFIGVKRVTGFELHVAEADLERATEILEQSGVLAPVDEQFLEQFEQDEGADDLDAYNEAVKNLPKGYPPAAEVDEDTETALLVSVGSTFEADRVEAAVRMEGIPVWRRNRHSGTSIPVMGATNLGVDLLVPVEMLGTAGAVLEQLGLLPGAPGVQDAPADPSERMDENIYEQKRMSRGWFLLILFGGGALLAALSGLTGLTKYLFGILF